MGDSLYHRRSMAVLRITTQHNTQKEIDMSLHNAMILATYTVVLIKVVDLVADMLVTAVR